MPAISTSTNTYAHRLISVAFVGILLMLTSCSSSDEAERCGAEDVIKLASEQWIDELKTSLAAGKFLNGGVQPSIDVEVSQARETEPYQQAIKLRKCEATATIKISGLNGLMGIGMLMNGVDPSLLAQGIARSFEYTVQITEDGQELVTIYTD